MGTTFKAACVQLNSGNDMQANIAQASAMVREAAAAGAQFIMTPEYTAMMDGSGRTMRETARDEAEHPALAAFRALAVETKAWLLVGSLTVTTGEERIANRSFLLSDAGEVVARYDKIHMFDVDLPSGEKYRESRSFAPGDKVVANSWGLSQTHHGGYAEKARVPGDWLVKLPGPISTRAAMARARAAGCVPGVDYEGEHRVDWTNALSEGLEHPVIHSAFGYAAQMVVINRETGAISKVVAAHDVGHAMNPLLCEGQIEGAVHMGLGYALTEDFPADADGRPTNMTLRSLGIDRKSTRLNSSH